MLVTDDGTITLQRSDREDFVNHRNEVNRLQLSGFGRRYHEDRINRIETTKPPVLTEASQILTVATENYFWGVGVAGFGDGWFAGAGALFVVAGFILFRTDPVAFE